MHKAFMRISFDTVRRACTVVALGATFGNPLGGPPHKLPLQTPAHRMLMIRVAQETRPGAGDFDLHVLGFIRALQTTGNAADFYQYALAGANYGNTEPTLTTKTSHLFFVNAADGLALFIVHNNSNYARLHGFTGIGGTAHTRWELSGGTASVLKEDDDGETTTSGGGTVFLGDMDWDQSNTDGMVIGALPVGFTILGQFTHPPHGLEGGWVVISADGSRILLQLVPGQRVRLDVRLAVPVRQDH